MNNKGTGTAAVVMDVVPLIMARIRSEMRSSRMSGLSILQFRALVYLFRHDDVSLSELAEHIGLKLPSTSKLIDSLAERQLVHRSESASDRRRISLKLSSTGLTELEKTRKSAGNRIAGVLSALTPEQHSEIVEALNVLKTIFINSGPGGGRNGQ